MGLSPPLAFGKSKMRTKLTVAPQAPKVSVASKMHTSARSASSESLARALGEMLSPQKLPIIHCLDLSPSLDVKGRMFCKRRVDSWAFRFTNLRLERAGAGGQVIKRDAIAIVSARYTILKLGIADGAVRPPRNL